MKLLTAFLIFSTIANSQIEVSTSFYSTRFSIANDEFLKNLGLKNNLNKLFINSPTIGIKKYLGYNQFKISLGIEYSFDKHEISGLTRKSIINNIETIIDYNRRVNIHYLNLKVGISQHYPLKNILLRSQINLSIDPLSLSSGYLNNLNNDDKIISWKLNKHYFTTLNLTFQQSIQLNKSEKNPLWFNLNMRYIPWTEYTYNQHTLWLGAGLSLGFNRKE